MEETTQGKLFCRKCVFIVIFLSFLFIIKLHNQRNIMSPIQCVSMGDTILKKIDFVSALGSSVVAKGGCGDPAAV